ncbi:MAG: cytochrome b/b6 domain-containing protein [Pseudomonadota bacterium]
MSESGDDRYPISIRLAHWATVLLVVLQAALALANALVYEFAPVTAERLVQAHIHVGFAIVLITLLRAGRRIRHRRQGAAERFRYIAHIVHGAFYGLLLTAGLSGYLKLAWLGFEIELFGVITLPTLGLYPPAASMATTLHFAATMALFALVVCHAAVAVFHKRWLGMPVLHRML